MSELKFTGVSSSYLSLICFSNWKAPCYYASYFYPTALTLIFLLLTYITWKICQNRLSAGGNKVFKCSAECSISASHAWWWCNVSFLCIFYCSCFSYIYTCEINRYIPCMHVLKFNFRLQSSSHTHRHTCILSHSMIGICKSGCETEWVKGLIS